MRSLAAGADTYRSQSPGPLCLRQRVRSSRGDLMARVTRGVIGLATVTGLVVEPRCDSPNPYRIPQERVAERDGTSFGGAARVDSRVTSCRAWDRMGGVDSAPPSGVSEAKRRRWEGHGEAHGPLTYSHRSAGALRTRAARAETERQCRRPASMRCSRSPCLWASERSETTLNTDERGRTNN